VKSHGEGFGDVIATADPGYLPVMPESPREIAHDVVEEVKELEQEAEEGASARTPLIVLSGVTVVVGAAVIVLLILAFSAYYLTK